MSDSVFVVNLISSAVKFVAPFSTSITSASLLPVPIDKLVSALFVLLNKVISPVDVIAPQPTVPSPLTLPFVSNV